MERERAPFAVLVTLPPPTRETQREAVAAGGYRHPTTGEEVPRRPTLTVGDPLEGKHPRLPTTQVAPVERAPRLRRRAGRRMAREAPRPEKGGTP